MDILDLPEALERLTERTWTVDGQHAGYARIIEPCAALLRAGIAQGADRLQVMELLDWCIQILGEDRNPARGMWAQQQLINLKGALYTAAEKAEMDALAARIIESLETAR